MNGDWTRHLSTHILNCHWKNANQPDDKIENRKTAKKPWNQNELEFGNRQQALQQNSTGIIILTATGLRDGTNRPRDNLQNWNSGNRQQTIRYNIFFFGIRTPTANKPHDKVETQHEKLPTNLEW